MTAIAPGHAIYEGEVWHHRRAPNHRFTKRVAMAWLDLDRLDEAMATNRLFSDRAWSPVQFRRSDFHGDPSVPLAEAVRTTVAERLGHRPDGTVHLLANLRTWGWCFNPIAIYWCADRSGTPVAQMVEVTNTPWKERHQYVFSRDGGEPIFFDKAMHVSPFLPMDLGYTVHDAVPSKHLRFRMLVHRGEELVFSAGVHGTRRAFDDRMLRRVLTKYPTQRVSLGIHTQALRLLGKGARFLAHPRHHQPEVLT